MNKISFSQAIQSKFLPATDHKPTRIKAWCHRGNITISSDSIPDSIQRDTERHSYVVDMLVTRFVNEDTERYGANQKNPWSRPRICGTLPGGNMAHIFLE